MKGAIPFILAAFACVSAGAAIAQSAPIDEILNACRADSDQRTEAPALPPPPKAVAEADGAAKPGAAKPKKKARAAAPAASPRGSSWAYAEAQKAALAGNDDEAIDWLLDCPQAAAAEDLLRAETASVVARLIDDARQSRKKALPLLPQEP